MVMMKIYTVHLNTVITIIVSKQHLPETGRVVMTRVRIGDESESV